MTESMQRLIMVALYTGIGACGLAMVMVIRDFIGWIKKRSRGDIMTRDRLRAFRAKRRELRQLRDQIDELESRIYFPRGQEMTGMPRGSGAAGRAIENATATHLRLIELYTRRIEELDEEQAAIEASLTDLTPAERMIVRSRYISGRSWEQIAREVHFDLSHVYRLHAIALRKLEK